jgi:MOSC domain-containing protein YiiM
VSVLLSSIRVGLPRSIVAPKPWFSGFFKDPIAGPVRLSRETLAGDRQADLRVHGGPDKAVCVYSAEHYPAWRRELGIEDCGPGWFGENFSVEGQTEATACVGDLYRVGSALVQISQPRGPCWKLARRWDRPDLAQLVRESGRSGWYLRVLEEGDVAAGEPLTLTDRPFPRWTVARANELTYARGRTAYRVAGERVELAACPALAGNWRADLLKEAAAHTSGDAARGF